MDVGVRPGNPATEAADALIIPVLAGDVAAALAAMADGLGEEAGRLASEAQFTGKRGTTFVLPTFGRVPARRLVLAGVGPADALDATAVRRAWGAAALAARGAGAVNVVSALPPTGDRLAADAALTAAVEGVRLATYRFTKHHGAGRADDPAPREIANLTFVGGEAGSDAALARAEATAAGVALARDLVNEPASVVTPAAMAKHARRVAGDSGLEITVLGPDELTAMGAGAITAVGRGSANEPRLIHLTYRPAAGGSGQVIGLVGKGITFDTGGYSIKPYEGMLEMKGDMAGAAAVLGAMSALPALGCPHTVHAVLCAAENMISDRAFRPGDILTALNGVTIEVLSTDAEGRLVLADGLVYAARQGATELIDLATLTGAAMVALGDGTSALFASDDRLAADLLAAAGAADERAWRMPLVDALNGKIKGQVGDIKNTGGRNGGAITAALFLHRFTEGLPWAHLDIAPSARTDKAGAAGPRGATGVGVRTLLAYLTALASAADA